MQKGGLNPEPSLDPCWRNQPKFQNNRLIFLTSVLFAIFSILLPLIVQLSLPASLLLVPRPNSPVLG